MKQDLRYSIRVLLKNPVFTGMAVIALALGIGVTSVMFSIVNAVLLSSLPFEKPDRILRVWGTMDKTSQGHMVASYPDVADWRDQAQSFDKVAAYNVYGVIYTGSSEPILMRGAGVSADLFPLLGTQPMIGRAFTPEEDKPGGPRVVVLSHGAWQRLFGADRNLIGQEILLSNRSTTVLGVMPPEFKFPVEAEQVDFWMPLTLNANPKELETRGHRKFNIVARLKPNVTQAQAQSEMNVITRQLETQYPETNEGYSVALVSLHEDLVSGIRPALLALFVAIGLVLLIACANIANLLLARAASRQKEMALRTALGATRIRIIRQLITESVVLSLAGGILGLFLSVWGMSIIAANLPASIPRVHNVGVDARVLLFTLALSVLTGIAFGLAPALQSSRPNLNESLKEGGRGYTQSFRRNKLRNVLVVAEVAISLVLLICAGLLIKSFLRLTETDMGFNTDRLLTVSVSPSRSRYPEAEQQKIFYKRVLEEIGAAPGVQSASAIDFLPLSGDNRETSFVIEGRPLSNTEEDLMADYATVTPNYFSVMGIPLLKGRAFTESDNGDSPKVLIVNEIFARTFFADEDPIGKRVVIGSDDPPGREIVGIVGDVRRQGLDTDAKPGFFVTYLQTPQRFMNYVARTSTANPMSVSSSVRSAIRNVDSAIFIPDSKSMDQMLAATVAQRWFNTSLLLAFAVAGLILAITGIYGVMSYSVTQRTHEIGIRSALGAQAGDILKLVIGHGMVLTAIGIVVGLIAAFAATKFIASLLYGVSANDFIIYAGFSLLLTVVALLACYFPARKATRVDPIVALRVEQ
jgi:putative ABC transport system permease protein